MADAPPRPDATRPSAIRRLAPLLLLIAAGLAAFAIWGDALSFETLRDNRAALLAWRDAAPIATAAAYVAVYVAVVACSIPGAAAMTLTGGFLFGPVAGGALAVTGATIGATILFLAARAGFGDALLARLRARGGSGAFARIEAGLRANEASYLLLMRLVPAVPFFVANLAPAFLGVRARTYVWTTFVGIMPGGFVYAWIGSGLGAVFDRGEAPDLSLLADPRIVAPILALAALAALPIVVRALRRGRAAG